MSFFFIDLTIVRTKNVTNLNIPLTLICKHSFKDLGLLGHNLHRAWKEMASTFFLTRIPSFHHLFVLLAQR